MNHHNSIIRTPSTASLIALRMFALFMLISLCSGCCLNDERWRKPNLFHPGHIDDQRYNAQITDPLPAPGVGMKNSGLRPRDADLPWDPCSARSLSLMSEKVELRQTPPFER